MAKLTDDEKERARKNQEYWEKREKAQAAAYQLEESELEQRILARYNYLLTEIDARINDFYQRFAKAEGITMNLAEMAVSQMDVKAYSTRAAQLVKDRDFSPKANQELRLYNATMRINRLEMLKSRIGLELVDTYQQLEDEFGAAFRNRCTEEYERQAGILGQSTNVMPQKDIERILTADFNNANWSSRLWANQGALRDRLSEMLTNGIIQGRSVRVLAKDLEELLIDPSAANALRLMRTEMNRVQTETQMQSFRDNGYRQYMFISTEDSRTCSQCAHLNGEIFDVDDPEALKPPQHPNCRCSTAAYMDRAEVEKELFGEENSYMSRRADVGNWPTPGTPITEEQLKELVAYGAKNHIDVISFENFDGDVEFIKTFIDDLTQVAKDYPEILSGKRNLQLRCSYQMDAKDYAETTKNCISLNGNAFRSREALEKDYDEQQAGDNPFFVVGTTYRNIVHHEVGHLIIDTFSLSPKRIVQGLDLSLVSEYAKDDVNEAIAESFSAYYANVDNKTALQIKERCDTMIAERRAAK